jgi:biopolymer transport protein ExbD
MAPQDQNSSEDEIVAFEKKDRKGPRAGDDTSDLNINSMMDMITILLVFLLVTLTSDPLSIKQDDFLLLAKSTVDYNPQDSVPVTLTKNKIIVDNKAVVKVDCSVGGQVCQREDYKRNDAFYSVDKSFKEDGDEKSFMIEPLHKSLEQIVKQQKEEAKELGREFKPVATIICDGNIPFRLIAETVYTSGMAGLSELNFAIIKTSNRAGIDGK